jgi:hypothetical protein
MKAVRRPTGTTPYELNPGDVAFYKGQWWACLPNGDKANLKNHSVVEKEDGTIDVTPSILCKGNAEWHGYLTDGVWKEC